VNDEVYMDRALELARSVPFTSPNPRVGAVLVRDGQIISEGAHQGAGTPHAEALALEGTDAAGATLYVNLEPCSHHGRMPPCAPAVAGSGVERVVAAMSDPDERVSGRGFDVLRAAGVRVDVGFRDSEALRLNAPFVHHRNTGRPLVTVKLALSLDGRLAARDGTSQWITGPEARGKVHRRRAEADALLVGANTVVADDPSLTARDVGATHQPLRVIADARGIVAPDARAITGGGEAIVATTRRCSHERQTAYKEAGAEVLELDEDERGVDLHGLMAHLGERGFLEVYCEGGGALAGSLVRAGLADRLELFYGPVVLGDGPSIEDAGVETLSDAERWIPETREPVGDGFALALNSSRLASLLTPAEGRA
jgi:diaminohydroxyphosphoribosylaminopyrimidine deaminase/5-amino-6-(5-phosphoribosylamino)uracil reductase